MPSAAITSKGQITVPKQVRDALGVKPGDRVAFRVQDDGTVLVEAETIDLISLKGSVKSAVRGVTLDDMDRAIRKAANRK